MNKIKFILYFLPIFFFITNCTRPSTSEPSLTRESTREPSLTRESTGEPSLTRESTRELLANPPQNQEQLNIGTFHGCVLIPATGYFKKKWLGFESTGESCWVKVNKGNNVEVSFIRNTVTPVVQTRSPNQYPTDTFIGELKNNQVIVVQHADGEVLAVSQTIYDKKGHVVYGRFGEGDNIQSCHIEYGKSIGLKTCER